MHRLDMTMAAHSDVHHNVYAIRHLQNCLAIEGHICFDDAKDKAMVQNFVPKFWLRMYDHYGKGINYTSYLCHHSLFVKRDVTSRKPVWPVISSDILLTFSSITIILHPMSTSIGLCTKNINLIILFSSNNSTTNLFSVLHLDLAKQIKHYIILILK